MTTAVLTGGGTAGHIIPNLALLPELKKHFDYIYYIGGIAMEAELVPQSGIEFFSVEAIKLDRQKIINNLKIPAVLFKGIRQTKDIFTKNMPDVVFSKGGYAALPACFAAKQLSIPLVIHESDYTLGVANKLTSSFAAKLLTSFKETPNGIYTGNPIREELYSGNSDRARYNYRITTNKPVVLIFGGSLGAAAINDVVYNSLDTLTKKYFVVHISGKTGDRMKLHADYLQLSYAKDIYDLFALANVVVSRGGSNALNELACMGKRALIIPLPKGASRGDQLQNALSYQKRGYFVVLNQSDLNETSLSENIDALYRAYLPPKIQDGRAINKKIVEEILSVIKRI